MKTSQRIRPNSSDSDLVNNNSPLLPTRLDEKSEDTNMSKGSMPDFGRNVKLLFCFVGLQISYVLWGVVQEQLMTQEYKFGKFKSSAFCVFGNRFLALFISLAIVIFRGLTTTKPMKIAPYYWYAPSSLSNSLSSWAQYEALKFVSFPTQVLSKSCKIIPVMLVRLNFHRYLLSVQLRKASNPSFNTITFCFFNFRSGSFSTENLIH